MRVKKPLISVSISSSVLLEERRRDFRLMTLHHGAAIVLLSCSWMINFVRVGCLVLISHDAADVLLSVEKIAGEGINAINPPPPPNPCDVSCVSGGLRSSNEQ